LNLNFKVLSIGDVLDKTVDNYLSAYVIYRIYVLGRFTSYWDVVCCLATMASCVSRCSPSAYNVLPPLMSTE